MGSSSAWAAAGAVLGKGLLDFGANRETLKYQKERDESLAALQREQMAETSRHNQAGETLAVDTLAVDKEHKQGLLKNDTTKLGIDGRVANAEIENLSASRDQDQAKTDLLASEKGFKWNAESKTYEFDQDLFDKSLERTKAEGTARAAAYGGSKGAFEREYEITHATLTARRDEGDPALQGKTDAQLSQMALDSANLTARKQEGTNGYEQAAMLKSRVSALDTQIPLTFDKEERARMTQERDDLLVQWMRLTNGGADRGGLLSPPPSGAATAAGNDYLNSLR